MLLKQAPAPARVEVTDFREWLRDQDATEYDGQTFEIGQSGDHCTAIGKYVIDPGGDVYRFATSDDAYTYAEIMAGPQGWTGEDVTIVSERTNVSETWCYVATGSHGLPAGPVLGVADDWKDLLPAITAHQEDVGIFAGVWLTDDAGMTWEMVTWDWDGETKSIANPRLMDTPSPVRYVR